MDRDNTISLQDMLLKAHRFHLAHEGVLSDAVDRKAAQLALEAVRLEERADTRPECSQLDAVVSGSLTAGHLRTQPEHRWAWEQIRDCRPAALQLVLAERQASDYMRDPWEYMASQLRLEFTFDPHDTKDRDSQGNPIDDTELFDDTMGNRLEMYCCEARQGNSAVNRLSMEIARLNAHGWGQRLADRIKEQYPREWQEIMGPHGAHAAGVKGDACQKASGFGPMTQSELRTFIGEQAKALLGPTIEIEAPSAETIRRWAKRAGIGKRLHRDMPYTIDEIKKILHEAAYGGYEKKRSKYPDVCHGIYQSIWPRHS